MGIGNGSDWDVLGRHNSLGVNGWSWFTFAGDTLDAPEHMNTASISPL